MINQFADKYKTFSTSKLLEILENSKDYQYIAIEAAKSELACRNDVEIAHKDFNEKRLQAQQQEELDQKKRKNIQDKTSNLLEYADPFTKKTPEKSIVILCVVLLFMFLFQLANSYNLITYTITNFSGSDFSIYWFFIELLYLPITIYFLWQKTKAGWFMFLFWLIYQIIMDITYLYLTSQLPDVDSSYSQIIDLPSTSSYILKLCFHSAFVYFIFKPSIKNLFYQEIKNVDNE